MALRQFFLRWFWVTLAAAPGGLQAQPADVPAAETVVLTPRYRYVQLGAGASLFALRDRAMSPLRYRGANVSAYGGYQKQKGAVWQQGGVDFHYGELSPAVYNFGLRGIAQHLRAEATYSYLRQLHPGRTRTYRWWVGGTFSTLGTYRLHLLYSNNAYNWEVLTHLSAAARVERSLRLLRRTFLISYRAFVPVVGVGWRPSYTSVWSEPLLDPDARTAGNSLRSGKLLFPGRFFRYHGRLDFDYPFGNGNALRLTYVWDYYRYQAQQPVAVGTQQLLFSTLFRF